MSQITMQRVVGQIRQTLEIEQAPDGALLDAFVGERSERAFTELVRRHGPMVWGVCWRLLASRQDAEDCYQATFLVLIRKGGTVHPRSRVGAWLHGVAFHIALKARHLAARRSQMEQHLDPLPEPIRRTDANADLRHLLDRGLSELPDKYRIPIVLCELEGRGLKEVAEQMGCPIGTLAGWLARGRNLLARRLIKHGLSAAAIAALLAEPARAAPPAFASSAASATASALADASVRTLFVGALRSWLVAAAALVVLMAGLTWMFQAAGGETPDLPRHVGVAPLPNSEHERSSALIQKKEPVLITKDAEKAIDAGLAYLAKEQFADGSWGTNNFRGNVGITGLAGSAFLAGKHHPDQGKYGNNVTKAIRYVLNQEVRATPGFFHNAQGAAHGPMYGHGFGMLFLADAYGSIPDKKLKADVKAALERAVKMMGDVQNQEGGWRYLPVARDADITVTACQVVALRATRDAGIEVPQAILDKAARYIKSCQNKDDGGFRYMANGGTSGFARTAAGLTALNRTGVKEDEVAKKAMTYVQGFGPGAGAGKMTAQIHGLYGVYYAAKVMHRADEKEWQKWYPAMRDELLDLRKNNGHWDHGALCPHFSSATALIVLQAPHGHLPSMKR